MTRLSNPSNKIKILFGSDTDVTFITFVKMHQDHYVVTHTWEGFEDHGVKAKSTVNDWSLKELKEEFDKQYGAPMMYMSQEDFNWLTT